MTDDLDAAAARLINTLLFDDNPVLIARAGKCEKEMVIAKAALRAQRRAVWELVLGDLDSIGLLREQVFMSDEVKVFVRRCRRQAEEGR